MRIYNKIGVWYQYHKTRRTLSQLRRKKEKKIKVECRICAINNQFHGMGGCLRAWVKGGPNNCTDFTEIRKTDNKNDK